MAKSTALNFTQTINFGSVTILPADTTTIKDVYTAGTEGSIIRSVTCVSDDTAAVNLRVFIYDGAASIQIGTVNIPIASGTNGTASSVDVINMSSIPSLPLDGNGKRILLLKAGQKLQVAALATITALKTVTVSAMAEDY
jgi:hypothetical protein